MHGRGRNCSARNLTGSALLDYSNVLHLESSFRFKWFKLFLSDSRHDEMLEFNGSHAQ